MTVRAGLVAVALLATLVIGVTPVRATNLDGVELTAELIINGLATNFFDPASGQVPDGFGNSSIAGGGSGTASVIVSDAVVEYGYAGAGTLMTMDFTTTGAFTFQSTPYSFTSVAVGVTSPGLPSSTQITTTPGPFGGCSFGPLGGLTCSFVTASIPFAVTGQIQVPAPASVTLLGLGLGFAGLVFRLRKRPRV
jgi:hypothetical protein